MKQEGAARRQQACYWGRFISACYVGGAHVVLVGSRADTLKDRGQPEAALRQLQAELHCELESLKNVELERKVFVIDCRKALDAGTKAFKLWLSDHCKAELQACGALPVPRLCEEIRGKLHQVRQLHPVMSWGEYFNWVRKTTRHSSLEPTLVIDVSHYLHDFGDIVFIKKGVLRNWVFVEPSVLCENLLGKLLCPERISAKPIPPVCPTAKEVAYHIEWTVCEGDPAVLILLLQEFGLCFGSNRKHQDDGKQEEEEAPTDPSYFFPMFLPDSSGKQCV
jgi:hypothetical protein